MNWSRLPLILSIAALATAAVSWIVTTRQVEELRDAQRSLAGDVASLRNAPVVDVAGASSRGSSDAVVALVEFSDYECPFCIRHLKQTTPQIETDYIETGKVRYFFRDFPVDRLHPAARRAHEAGRCAGEQGKFWEMHARLFSPAGSHTPEALEQRAAEAGLKMDAYRACVTSGRMTDPVNKSVAEAMELGANGTPFFFIGVFDRDANQV
jgi:protein-disulfide isomerase